MESEPQFTCDPTSAAPHIFGMISFFFFFFGMISYLPAPPPLPCHLGSQRRFWHGHGEGRRVRHGAHGPRLSVIKCKSVFLTHSETKQYQNVRVWSRERFISEPCKEMGYSCLKTQLPESLKQSPYKKGERGQG